MKFKLVTNCKIVEGAKRCTICDLQRNKIFLISKCYARLIMSWENKTLDEIRKISLSQISENDLDELFIFLKSNDLFFLSNTPKRFPDLSLDFHYPFEISNAILDFGKQTDYDVEAVLAQLHELRCEHIQLRFFYRVKQEEIEYILRLLKTNNSMITSLELIIWVKKEEQEGIIALRESYPRISSIIIYNALENKFIQPIRGKRGYIILTKTQIDSENHCGVISPKLFATNIESFTEGLNWNSCLNGKISVDQNGYIRNCPSMPKNFGHITKVSLKQALGLREFKEVWEINKDKIQICSDCEFRRVCTDCRAYLKDSEDIYSKPLKCGYDPYTTEWVEWKSNTLRTQDVINYN